MEIIASILFGLLPESIYFALFFIFAKKIESKRWLLFGLIFAVNLILSAFFAFSVWYHFLFIFLMYGILWLLYRAEFIDIFVVTSASFILAVLGFACYFLIPNYWVAAIINRAGMFAFLFLTRNKLNSWYMIYRRAWNRRPGAKVKSITVRNISMVLLNLMLYALSIMAGIIQARFM